MSIPTISKITASDPLAASDDLVAENIAKLKALFPELITEGEKATSVNVDVLKQLVGDQTLTDAEEKFGLNWHGKRAARQLSLTPSAATLLPQPDQSVEWRTTRNLFIEGDNLECLKVLKSSLSKQVDVIYIDPPYNTGNDFVYPDDFSDRIRHYLELTGQVENGAHASTNPDSSGRFHTNWLNMMYPRLRLARDLLKPTGVGFVSLDGNEMANCRTILADLFGEENVVATFAWASNLKGRQIADGGPVGTHEYILCFAKDASQLQQFRGSGSELRDLMPAVYKGTAYDVEHDAKGAFVVKNELYNTNSKFNERTAPTMVFRIHHNFSSGETRVTDVDDTTQYDGFTTIMPHRNARSDVKYHAWRWSRAKVLADADDLKFERYGDTARIYTKIRDVDGMAIKDLIIGPSTVTGQDDLESLQMSRTFDTVKPIDLLRVLIAASAPKDATVLDFFAGSASTGHAVMAQNAVDGGTRRFILIQLPLPLDADRPETATAVQLCRSLKRPANIAEVAKERLRRAGSQVLKQAPMSQRDIGFRVYSLAESNFKTWSLTPDDVTSSIHAGVEHIRAERTDEDLLTELTLRLGIDLCVDVEFREISGKKLFSLGAGTIMGCLATSLLQVDVEHVAQALAAWHVELAPARPATIVFRDGAFDSDVTKFNALAILEQQGLTNVRSV
jgi:adenine-specific DNA-methyltransferase